MRFAILILTSTLLASCMSARILEQWPEEIPDQRHFRQLYQTDKENAQLQSEIEYLTWVARFYQGWEMMPIGWDDISGSVLVDLEPEQFQHLHRKLHRIGSQISGEWAKDNSVREIDSRMLSLWAGVMQADFSSEYRVQAVDLIAQDVAMLLSGRLAPEAVDEYRYSDALGVSLEP